MQIKICSAVTGFRVLRLCIKLTLLWKMAVQKLKNWKMKLIFRKIEKLKFQQSFFLKRPWGDSHRVCLWSMGSHGILGSHDLGSHLDPRDLRTSPIIWKPKSPNRTLIFYTWHQIFYTWHQIFRNLVLDVLG